MDVHAPQGSIHTWRDFWIHLGTIAIGLLIALGLEQGVEGLHHIHQRHQLEADMHTEGEKTAEALRVDLRYLNIRIRDLLDEKEWVDAMADSHNRGLPMPASIAAGDTELAGLNFSNPTMAVWTTAESSQLAALLPRQEAEMYERVYWQSKASFVRFDDWQDSFNREAGYQVRFAERNKPEVADVSRMNEAQMNEWAGLLAMEFQRANTLKRYYAYFYGANDAMLRGVTSEQQMIQSMYRAREAMADDFGAAETSTPSGNAKQRPQTGRSFGGL